MSDFLEDVERHWHADAEGTLLARIDRALAESGRDPEHIGVDDLLAVDEFHIRGREATQELADLANVTRDEHVIDVGSGIGGPSRFLADQSGCRVTGIDLTAEYCRVADALARRVGLGDRLHYQRGDALDLEFDDASFDVAWTQHISMNIPDKRRFFGEIRRVLKPGGRLALYDPILGDGEDLEFPVPWSRDGEINFLEDAETTRATIEEAGFRIDQWHDVSQKSIDWFEKQSKATTDLPATLGLHLLLGEVWPTMASNMVKNLNAGRLRVIQVIALR